MKPIPKLIMLLLMASIFSCSKKDVQVGGTAKGTGLVTERGAPMGVAVTRLITPQGGTVTSADGRLSVLIPGGALTENTTVSIQPITSTTPNGTGLSYRLQPEGTHFLQPVTILFHYDPGTIKGSLASFLNIAWQDSSGVWLVPKGVLVNSSNQTVSVQSNHFSDWSCFENYKLEVADNVLGYHGQTQARVMEATILPDLRGNEVITQELTDNKVSHWQLLGDGQLISNGGAVATYFAPDTTPTENPVPISVEVDDIIGPQGDHGKEILFNSIEIAEGYMEVSFNGKSYRFGTCTASLDPATESLKMIITGSGIASTGQTPGSVSIELNATDTGSYFFGDVLKVNFALLTANFDNQPQFYFSQHGECNSNNVDYGGGHVTISKIESVGAFVEGSFNGQVFYETNPCQGFTTYTIEGVFRAKREN